MLASIVVNNHNYAPYLAQAIDSALEQTYPDLEVIVVDDGSVDGSRRIIEGYGDRIVPVYGQHGGQCAACHAGFIRSRGEVVVFLDADDVLLKDAVALHMDHMSRGHVVKSCGYMAVMDAAGRLTGRRVPRQLPRSGDYRNLTLARGIDTYEVSFTSAHAWSRTFLKAVLPLPNDNTIGIDGYLTAVDRLFGRVEFIHRPVAFYRRHDTNKGPSRFSFDASYLSERLERKYYRVAFAESWVQKLGYQADTREFRKLRDWRLALMQHVLVLWGRRSSSPSFFELVASPFQRHRPSISRSVLVALGLAVIRWTPKPLAIRLARRILQHAHQRRATFLDSTSSGPTAAGAR
jgi:glycosyltransferase involved in cell wall biosynthesis